jgi:hypothetical protein
MTLSVSGPGGGRVVKVDGCPDCPRLGRVEKPGDCEHEKARAADITLPPGSYRVVIQHTDAEGNYAWTGRWELDAAGTPSAWHEGTEPPAADPGAADGRGRYVRAGSTRPRLSCASRT